MFVLATQCMLQNIISEEMNLQTFILGVFVWAFIIYLKSSTMTLVNPCTINSTKEKKDQNLLKHLINVFSFLFFFLTKKPVIRKKKQWSVKQQTRWWKLFLLYLPTFSVTDMILSCFIWNNYHAGNVHNCTSVSSSANCQLLNFGRVITIDLKLSI